MHIVFSSSAAEHMWRLKDEMKLAEEQSAFGRNGHSTKPITGEGFFVLSFRSELHLVPVRELRTIFQANFCPGHKSSPKFLEFLFLFWISSSSAWLLSYRVNEIAGCEKWRDKAYMRSERCRKDKKCLCSCPLKHNSYQLFIH